MAWQCNWRVTCECCKTLGPVARESAKAEAKAVRKGWLQGNFYGMALHLCPTCVAKGLPDWWPDATGWERFHWEG